MSCLVCVRFRSVRIRTCHVRYVSGLDLPGLGRVRFGMSQVWICQVNMSQVSGLDLSEMLENDDGSGGFRGPQQYSKNI